MTGSEFHLTLGETFITTMFISTKIRKTTETVSELIEESLAVSVDVLVNERETVFKFVDGSYIHMKGTVVEPNTGKWKKAGSLTITNGDMSTFPTIDLAPEVSSEKKISKTSLLNRVLLFIKRS